MDMRVLEYFLVVAREENITRAAAMLHITQPTLSRQLAQLEREVGAKLFVRSNHSIRLTDEGMLFRRRAREILDLAQRAVDELVPNGGELTGEICIGCGEMRAASTLAHLIASFRELHPHVHFTLSSGNNADVRERIENGSLDLGLMLEPVELDRYEFVRLPQSERWGVLVREDSPLAKRSSLKRGDLSNIPVVTIRDSLVHAELASWSGDAVRDMSNFATYNLVHNAAALVREGAGPAVCLDLDQSFPELVFIPFEPPIEMGAVLAWKGQASMPRQVEAFIEHSRIAIESM